MIGVIADDLTGAAETGAVGLRHGLRAEVIPLGVEASFQAFRRDEPLEAGTPTTADLTCRDTDSRSCPSEAAGRRAANAAKTLFASGAKWIFKKVDSVLRGHVASELEAVMKELGLPRALLVPANPTLGRVIRDGNYLVRGQLIHETDFRNDPEYPRYSPAVRDLLGTAGCLPIQVCGVGKPLPSAGIIVGETENAADLRAWAGRRDGTMLLAGGAEFFSALLAAAGHSPAAITSDTVGSGSDKPELFVCGSASEACRNFVAESRQRGTPVFSLPEELACGAEFASLTQEQLIRDVQAALETGQRVVLAIGMPRVNEQRIARRLLDHLTELAAAVVSRTSVGHIYVEGGATAASLVTRAHWTRLEVKREIALGVVTLRVPGKTPRCLLTIKPGSYAWPPEVRM